MNTAKSKAQANGDIHVFNRTKCEDLFTTDLLILKCHKSVELVCNDMVNLIFIETGVLSIESAEGEVVLEQGNVFLAEEKLYNLKSASSSQDTVILSVGLTLGMLSRFKQRYESAVVHILEKHLSSSNVSSARHTPFIFEGCDLTRMAITTFRLFGEQPDFGLYSLKLEELLLLQLRRDNGYLLLHKIHSRCDPSKERFRNFVQENVLNDWSLSCFAKNAKMSLSSFKVMFRQVFSETSPKAWINERRLQHADKELRTTSKKIIDIAMESGFSSQSYFTQSYKARFSRSPSEKRHHR